MVVGPIRTIDLDYTAFNSIFLEIVVHRNKSPLTGVGARRHSSVFGSKSYDCRGSLS